jgi:hypothetical protein
MILPEVQTDGQYAKNSGIIISKWSGRLGNNLIQLSNALFLCLKYKCQLEYPEHPFLRRKTFTFSEASPKQFYINFFYDRNDCRGVFPSLAERQYIFHNYVSELLTFDLDRQPLPLDENRLVLQIRSGDTFGQRLIPTYVPSPVSYYSKIIKMYKDQAVVIVCEDLRNPSIEFLAQNYPNCTIQSSDLESDVQTLVNASHLVLSIGTFGLVWALMSKRLRHLYVNDIPKSIDDHGFFTKEDLRLGMEVHRYHIHRYLPYGSWKNTPVQVQSIFDHSEDHISLFAPSD